MLKEANDENKLAVVPGCHIWTTFITRETSGVYIFHLWPCSYDDELEISFTWVYVIMKFDMLQFFLSQKPSWAMETSLLQLFPSGNDNRRYDQCWMWEGLPSIASHHVTSAIVYCLISTCWVCPIPSCYWSTVALFPSATSFPSLAFWCMGRAQEQQKSTMEIPGAYEHRKPARRSV